MGEFRPPVWLFAWPMLTSRTTLPQYLMEEQRRHEHSTGDFNALVLEIALACKAIAQRVARGALDSLSDPARPDPGHLRGSSVLDAAANDAFQRATEWGGRLAGMVSENVEEPITVPPSYPRGKYLLLFDPLDGATNIDINAAVGSIFSVLRTPHPGEDARAEDFLQPGTEQVAAGYALYGPATMLVLTVGRGVHGFTLDQGIGEFFLTHPDMTVPEDSTEFAINHSNRRFWEPAVRRYVDECVAGKSGPRGRNFSVRWVASLVAEAHRVLTRGGVFLYPSDARDEVRPGRLRLLQEVNPIAFVIEQAGGGASNGRSRVLETLPEGIHERVPFLFGAREEIGRIERYHAETAPDSAAGEEELDLPFFAVRGLFRTSSSY